MELLYLYYSLIVIFSIGIGIGIYLNNKFDHIQLED